MKNVGAGCTMEARGPLLLLLALPAAEAMARHRHVRIGIPGRLARPQHAQRQRLARGVEARPLVPAPAAAAAGLGGVALAAAILGTGLSGQVRRLASGPRRGSGSAASPLPDSTLDNPAITQPAAALLEAMRAGDTSGAVAAAPVQVREAALALAILAFCDGKAAAPPAAALAELRSLADTVGGGSQLPDAGGRGSQLDKDAPGQVTYIGGGPGQPSASGVSVARAVRMASTASARNQAGRPMPNSPAEAAKEAAAGALLLLCEGALLRGVEGMAEAAAVRTRFNLPPEPSATFRLRRSAAATITTSELRRFLPRPGSATHADPLSPQTLVAARAALAPLPALLGMPPSQLRTPLLNEAADYLYDCLEVALRAWVASRIIGAPAGGMAPDLASDLFAARRPAPDPSIVASPAPFVLAGPDPFVSAGREPFLLAGPDPFVLAEAAADVALMCAAVGAGTLTLGDVGEMAGDVGEIEGSLVQIWRDLGGVAGDLGEIAPSDDGTVSPSGASLARGTEAGQLYLWQALSRQLFPVRITTVTRHDFYNDYLFCYARRAAAAARGDGGDGGGWPIQPGGDALTPVQLARPAALAALLGALPSAVRRDCAAAVELAREEAWVVGADAPPISALERALGFARHW